MKTLLSLLRASLLGLALVTGLHAADAFEGRIHMDISDGKKAPQGIDYAIKTDRMRFDPPVDKSGRGMGAGGIIIDFKAKEMIILMDMQGQKMFMRRPFMQGGMPAQGAPAAAGNHAPAPAMAAPVATGRTATIAGYPATEYTLKSDKGEVTELWLAKGLGTFMSFAGGNPMARGPATASPAWEAMAREGGFFPLRVITHDASGAVKGTMEVTKIDKTPLPESLFSTDGYSEFQIPGMSR